MRACELGRNARGGGALAVDLSDESEALALLGIPPVREQGLELAALLGLMSEAQPAPVSRQVVQATPMSRRDVWLANERVRQAAHACDGCPECAAWIAAVQA